MLLKTLRINDAGDRTSNEPGMRPHYPSTYLHHYCLEIALIPMFNGSHSRSSYPFDKHIPVRSVRGLNRRCRKGAKRMHCRKARYAYRRYAVSVMQMLITPANSQFCTSPCCHWEVLDPDLRDR